MPRATLDKETLLEDLKATSERVDGPLTADVYNENGEFHVNTFRNHFGKWNNAKDAVGLDLINPNQTRGGKYNISERRERLRDIREESECESCGGDFRYPAMDFHHLDKEDKVDCVSRMPETHTWGEIEEEMEKCAILCSNCHRMVEAGVKELQL